MRDTTTVSLPEGTLTNLQQYAARRGFSSLSEYFLFAVEQDQAMISEDEVLDARQESNKEYKSGKHYSGLDTLKEMTGM